MKCEDARHCKDAGSYSVSIQGVNEAVLEGTSWPHDLHSHCGSLQGACSDPVTQCFAPVQEPSVLRAPLHRGHVESVRLGDVQSSEALGGAVPHQVLDDVSCEAPPGLTLDTSRPAAAAPKANKASRANHRL
eukprot:5331902-Amphidinium_carterae.1